MLGRNPIQRKNYNIVNQVKEMNSFKAYTGTETVILGYVFREDGRYQKHYLAPGLDNIAKFICSSEKDKLLCNADDKAIACTMGEFLDVGVENFVEEILPFLKKYQNKRKWQTFDELH